MSTFATVVGHGLALAFGLGMGWLLLGILYPSRTNRDRR